MFSKNIPIQDLIVKCNILPSMLHIISSITLSSISMNSDKTIIHVSSEFIDSTNNAIIMILDLFLSLHHQTYDYSYIQFSKKIYSKHILPPYCLQNIMKKYSSFINYYEDHYFIYAKSSSSIDQSHTSLLQSLSLNHHYSIPKVQVNNIHPTFVNSFISKKTSIPIQNIPVDLTKQITDYFIYRKPTLF